MKNSALGDKIDFSGKLPQIEIFIDKTYKLLIKNKLEWIKIGDVNAGILDDIQYSTADEVHAYQMKWSNQENAPTFSYRNFKELIPELIKSWERICANNINKLVIGHLISSQKPSRNDILKFQEKKIGSFEDFLSDYYGNIREGKEPSNVWSSFMKSEIEELNISVDDFNNFLKNFIFDFSEKRPNYSFDTNSWKIENDFNNYKSFILDQYYNPKSQVTFNSKEILKFLNLIQSTTFKHDFWVDLDIYTPNIETINELNEIIEKQNGGYILLSGKPGTGKSTLLTEWIKTRKDRVIKYYAYSNKYKIENIPERGSAKNLFFDLVFQIAELGLYNERVYPYKDSIEQIHSTFIRQLSYLNKEFILKNEKTIIIIDGLDHIPREYKINDSLIKYLPPVDEIPDGVFIILGSQTYQFDNIDLKIQSLQNDPERSITIKPLTKEIIYEIINKSTSLKDEIKEKIYKISEGHPLYLSFILKAIQQADNIDSILESFNRIEDIVDYYESIWRNYNDQYDLLDLLGLIVRLRFGFDNRLIKEWNLSKKIQYDLFFFLNHFFDNSFDIWTIFHNSFKQFLIQKTSQNLFDKLDKSLEIDYHNRLVSFSESTTVLAFQFDKLYHLYESKQYDKFIEVATPDYFKTQIENLRPYYFVFEDLKMGQFIASERQQTQLLIRYAFISAEFSRREWNFSQDKFLDFSTLIVGSDVIKQFLFLPTNDEDTLKLKLARHFYKNGKIADAKLLYTMVQPDEITESEILIKENRRFSHKNEVNLLLQEWVLIAHYFSSVKDVISKIVNLKIENEGPHNEYYLSDSARLKKDLINGVFNYLLTERESEKLKEFIDCLNFSKDENLGFTINKLEEIIYYFDEEGDANSAKQILDRLLEVVRNKELSDYHRINIAYILLNIFNDKKTSHEFIKNVKLPHLEFKDLNNDEILLYRFIVLFLRIEGHFDFSTILALTKDDEKNVSIEFERSLFYLAKLKVESSRMVNLDIRRVYPIIRYFYQDHSILRHRIWKEIRDKRENLMFLLVRIVSLYSSESIVKLWNFFLSEFDEYPKYWKSFDFKIEILMQFYRIGLDKVEVKKQLIEFSEKSINQESSLEERIGQGLKIVEYYCELEEIDIARIWLRKAYNESLGVGYRKDYQLQFWLKWINKLNKIEPQNTYSRLQWLNSVNAHIQYTTEEAGSDVSEFILNELFKINIYDGVIQLKWQLENDLNYYTSSLNAFIGATIERITPDHFFILLDLWGKQFIYVHTYCDAELLKKIITKGENILPELDYKEFLNKIRYYLSIYPIYEFRQAYYQVLFELGIEIEDCYETPKIEKKDIAEKNLYLINGEVLSLNDLKNTIKNFKDLLFYFQNQEFSYSNEFDWTNVFSLFKEHIKEANIHQLFEILKRSRFDIERALFNLAEFSIKNCYPDVAREIIYHILTNTRNTWIHHYDGAKRLQAFKLLIEIDGETARKEAFADYALKTIENNSSDLFDVDEILKVINPSYQDIDICYEIEAYMKRLFATAEISQSIPLFKQKEFPLDYIIADLLLFYANQNILSLSQTAISIYIKWLAEGKIGFIEKLKKYSKETSYKNQLNTIQILYCTYVSNQSVIQNFIEELKSLVNSQLFEVSNKAKDLLYTLTDFSDSNINYFELERKWQLYENRLILNSESFSVFKKRFKNEDIKIEDIDLKIKFCTEILEKLSGIDKKVWRNKLLKISEELEENSAFQNFTINHNRYSKIDNSRLITGFVISKLAINILLKELYDLGVQGYTEEFEYLTNSIDSNFWLIEPQKQPSFIKGIIYKGLEKDKSHFYGMEENWYNKVEESANNYKNEFDDFIIIAESTNFICSGGNWETEDRNCFISRKMYNKLIAHIPFEVVKDSMLADYPEFKTKNDEFILWNWHDFEHRVPERILNWLAFNPKIALEMGWLHDEAGLFKWTDNDGKLMVESVYWMNGNMRTHDRHLNSEVGAGWFVKASKEAYKALKEKYTSIFKNIAFIRSSNMRQDDLEKTKSYTKSIKIS